MTLSHQEARSYYDWLGKKQDWQRFYEDQAVQDLLEHTRFETCHAVVEFGCGTGKMAENLLETRMPQTATYAGFDLSPKMISLAQSRLERFAPRTRLVLTGGETRLALEPGSCDRFFSTYVLDLLSEEDIRGVIDEAHRVLQPGGLLALVSLSQGSTVASRFVETLWVGVYSLRPSLLGGCRPISLPPFLDESLWTLDHQARIVQFGVASDVVVASRRPS